MPLTLSVRFEAEPAALMLALPTFSEVKEMVVGVATMLSVSPAASVTAPQV